jgi:hypothetical protein
MAFVIDLFKRFLEVCWYILYEAWTIFLILLAVVVVMGVVLGLCFGIAQLLSGL